MNIYFLIKKMLSDRYENENKQRTAVDPYYVTE